MKNIKIPQESFDKLKQSNRLFSDLKIFCIHQVMVTKNFTIWGHNGFYKLKIHVLQ